MTPHITINCVSKSYDEVKVVDSFNLSIKKGDFVVLLGPNGCGKTTLLNIVCGILKPDSGNILVDSMAGKCLSVGYVPQNAKNSLLPWKTNFDNISLPLELKQIFDKNIINILIKELLNRFKINIALQDYPYELSGGQQQLVAILRGFAVGSGFLVLDEPFEGIDYETRRELQIKLLEMWKTSCATVLLVSHNIDEAIFLANKIVVLSKKPAKVIAIYDNELPYPRNYEILTEPRFTELKKKVLVALEGIS